MADRDAVLPALSSTYEEAPFKYAEVPSAGDVLVPLYAYDESSEVFSGTTEVQLLGEGVVGGGGSAPMEKRKPHRKAHLSSPSTSVGDVKVGEEWTETSTIERTPPSAHSSWDSFGLPPLERHEDTEGSFEGGDAAADAAEPSLIDSGAESGSTEEATPTEPHRRKVVRKEVDVAVKVEEKKEEETKTDDDASLPVPLGRVCTSHVRVFSGDDWGRVLEQEGPALTSAFKDDTCAACCVVYSDLSNIQFTLGSLHAAVDILHDARQDSAAIDGLLSAYSFPKVMALYRSCTPLVSPLEDHDEEASHSLEGKDEQGARELEAQDEEAAKGVESGDADAAHALADHDEQAALPIDSSDEQRAKSLQATEAEGAARLVAQDEEDARRDVGTSPIPVMTKTEALVPLYDYDEESAVWHGAKEVELLGEGVVGSGVNAQTKDPARAPVVPVSDVTPGDSATSSIVARRTGSEHSSWDSFGLPPLDTAAWGSPEHASSSPSSGDAVEDAVSVNSGDEAASHGDATTPVRLEGEDRQGAKPLTSGDKEGPKRLDSQDQQPAHGLRSQDDQDALPLDSRDEQASHGLEGKDEQGARELEAQDEEGAKGVESGDADAAHALADHDEQASPVLEAIDEQGA
ncbi:hypothetical protein, conserved [Angomonas deanei]|uniref:Flagellar attachment zone protein 1 conserved domain-containing protein n=1 Tax=Angomonas deanei TaxID=59799 RepID=A0A7G2CMM2_9TRYP|nr:hypothetical protein, conserved [Angomonas deanei]